MLAALAKYAGKVPLPDPGTILKEVLDLLTADHTVEIEFENNTNQALSLIDTYHDSGRFSNTPDDQVPPNAASVFGSEDSSGSIGTGAIGTAVYALGAKNGSPDQLMLALFWSNPAVGSRRAGIWSYLRAAHGTMSAKDWFESFENNHPAPTENTFSSSQFGYDVTCTCGQQSTFSITPS